MAIGQARSVAKPSAAPQQPTAPLLQAAAAAALSLCVLAGPAASPALAATQVGLRLLLPPPMRSPLGAQSINRPSDTAADQAAGGGGIVGGWDRHSRPFPPASPFP